MIGENAGSYSASNNALIAISGNRYLVGGQSNSADGDLTGNKGNTDIWLICLDQFGSTLWQKNYGGTGKESIGGIQETSDHGFIVLGTSTSNDGDVSDNHGSMDYWVLRLDSAGNILWQKSYGGSGDEIAAEIKNAPDNGFILVGITRSFDGDVTGKHLGTDDNFDGWVVKIDPNGEIQWQKCIGTPSHEYLESVLITKDGNYLTAGISSNDSTCGRAFNLLVKLDPNGNVLWQNCNAPSATTLHSSLEDFCETNDGGYVLVGSRIERYPMDIRTAAYLVKVDSLGNFLWEKLIVDSSHHYFFTDVVQEEDGNFFISGVKSKYMSDGPADLWISSFSQDGVLNWEKVFGSKGSESNPSIVKSSDFGYLMASVTDGSDGDIIGKHNPTVRNTDIWILKLGASNTIKGVIYYDKNLNEIKDPDELLVSGAIVKSVKAGEEVSSMSSTGIFTNAVDTGSFVTSITNIPHYKSVPLSKTSVFNDYHNYDSINFAIQPIPGQRDLAITIIPINVARPGFTMSCLIYYRNEGTDTIKSGEILFKKDQRYNFLSATPASTSSNGDIFKWNYSNLKPFDTASILVNLRLQAPPAVNINDTLSSIAIITVTDDLLRSDDTTYLNQRVQGSYDPNDKSENLAGKISHREVSSNTYINYLIRFQNTGTDTAFTVTVRDTLDDKLDWSSLQMVAASHSYQLNIKSQNQLTWTFNNILLADSNRNEPASHGFIAYRVKPKNSLVIGDVIKNTASIYFDYNLPVETNTQETEVVQYSISNPQVAIPTISSFTPGSAASGSAVTIEGTYLAGATAVSFGGITATSFTVNSDTSITAVVGTGASGDVSVMTPGGTAILAGFTFIPAPTITSFTPTNGGTATSITISGTNFTGATAVSFGGIAATSFAVSSATSITAVVGTGASGSVSVVAPGGTATLAGFTFTVVTAIDPVPANSLGIRFYPNPTTGSFVIDTLKLSDNWETLEIFDTQGKQKLLNFTIRNKTRVNVNVEYLSTGLYMAILKRKNGRPTIVKFLKL